MRVVAGAADGLVVGAKWFAWATGTGLLPPDDVQTTLASVNEIDQLARGPSCQRVNAAVGV